jgi:hypothetical protein
MGWAGSQRRIKLIQSCLRIRKVGEPEPEGLKKEMENYS